MFELIQAPIGYGEVNTASFKDTNSDLYYQADRVKNRFLLDFGELQKDQRVGMELQGNGIATACLLKSIHAPAKNKTDDSLVWEVHHKVGQGVQERFLLQYVDRNDMPFIVPEFVLLPENVIYVIPGQDSRIFMVLEPINLLTVATQLL